MPSHIEERNDYAVHSLQSLDQNISNKVTCTYYIHLSTLKAGLHLRALRSLFFEQSFHAIGQKKNTLLIILIIRNLAKRTLVS